MLVFLFVLFSFSFANAEGFDPFIDYSDFEEESQEESDINFFHNGRLLSVGLLGGTRGYTGNYGSIYDNGGAFGLYVVFFFDLRFAMQVSYTVSDHAFVFNDGSVDLSGKNETTATSFDIKYYTNTQNVTKGLASFNPYFIGGLSQIYRTVNVDGGDKSRDGSLGFNMGAGIEIPFSRHSSYFGAEAKYTYVNFNDENKNLADNNGDPTNLRLNGDLYTIFFILGTNF